MKRIITSVALIALGACATTPPQLVYKGPDGAIVTSGQSLETQKTICHGEEAQAMIMAGHHDNENTGSYIVSRYQDLQNANAIEVACMARNGYIIVGKQP